MSRSTNLCPNLELWWALQVLFHCAKFRGFDERRRVSLWKIRGQIDIKIDTLDHTRVRVTYYVLPDANILRRDTALTTKS
jgi:hypothetical protein